MDYQDIKIPWEGWHVINKIGKGGFGSVYEIERSQYGIQERAAMKVITIPQSADEIDDLLIEGYDDNSITQRFDAFAEDIVREYGMMAQMKGNANIVYCDDYRIIQQDNGFGRDIYIRMELLTPLLKAMDRVSSEAQIIRFGVEMCNALEACQKRKVIHRDIKPQNIFVTDDGVFKLGDFGIARKAEKTTRATVGKGTYQFMAPEVKNEQPYGPTVDVYSLGLVMYWLLNNRRCPFFPLPPAVPTHKEEQDALRRRFAGEQIPAPRDGSEALKAIVLKACAFNPKDRYQSAREMREELVRLSGIYVAETVPEPEQVRISVVQEDMEEKTVGPVFKPAPVDDADDLDKTVGPKFSSKVEIVKDPSHKKREKRKSWKRVLWMILMFACPLVFYMRMRGNQLPGLVPMLISVAYVAIGALCAALLWKDRQDKEVNESQELSGSTLRRIKKGSAKRKVCAVILLIVIICLYFLLAEICIIQIIKGNIIVGQLNDDFQPFTSSINTTLYTCIGLEKGEYGIYQDQFGRDIFVSVDQCTWTNAVILIVPSVIVLLSPAAFILHVVSSKRSKKATTKHSGAIVISYITYVFMLPTCVSQCATGLMMCWQMYPNMRSLIESILGVFADLGLITESVEIGNAYYDRVGMMLNGPISADSLANACKLIVPAMLAMIIPLIVTARYVLNTNRQNNTAKGRLN